jgi:hypothetical protein
MAGDMQRWLSDIGLGNHAERFTADGIDWDVLSDLTETDLKELGLPLGDRKRLLKAIATLNASGAALATPDHGNLSAQGSLIAISLSSFRRRLCAVVQPPDFLVCWPRQCAIGRQPSCILRLHLV